jgi:copper homeostasis protein CutC
MLGIDRVLTSGGAAMALEGAPVIRRLVERAGSALVVMAGGGVGLEMRRKSWSALVCANYMRAMCVVCVKR